MRAYHLTADEAMLFFEICHELKAETEEQRMVILNAMASHGKVGFVVDTPKTKDEYVKHLADKFGSVLDITKKENQNGRE